MKKINYNELNMQFSKSTDIELRPFTINANSNFTAYIFCVDGLIDALTFDEAVLRPLSLNRKLSECKTEDEIIELLIDGAAYHAFASITEDADDLVLKVLSGNAAVFFDNKKAVVFDVRKFESRSVEEPQEETAIKGAKDCFVETIRTNTSLIRRRLRTPNLIIEQGTLGKVSQIDYAIAYIDNIADMQIVKRLKNRLKAIDFDNIPTVSFVEEFVIDNKNSLFPQAFYSQRPDRVSSNLTDGRVALIIGGTPFVYMFPCQLVSLMQSPEDYSQNYLIISVLRVLRYTCMVISLLLPALYIAMANFHTEMIPMQLAISIQTAKADVPFNSFIEVFGLLIGFEILMEAGLRISKNLGQAISVVGALVVGQASVDAKIVSPVVLIVTAVTAITAFTVPFADLSNTVRVLRFVVAIFAALWGFFGITIITTAILIHLCSLDNYGICYLSPIADSRGNRFKDTIFRFKVSSFKLRPYKVAPYNIRKQG